MYFTGFCIKLYQTNINLIGHITAFMSVFGTIWSLKLADLVILNLKQTNIRFYLSIGLPIILSNLFTEIKVFLSVIYTYI